MISKLVDKREPTYQMPKSRNLTGKEMKCDILSKSKKKKISKVSTITSAYRGRADSKARSTVQLREVRPLSSLLNRLPEAGANHWKGLADLDKPLLLD